MESQFTPFRKNQLPPPPENRAIEIIHVENERRETSSAGDEWKTFEVTGFRLITMRFEVGAMYRIEDLVKTANECAAYVNGGYVPARTIAFGGWLERLKDAWAVLTGKADAVKWTGQGEA